LIDIGLFERNSRFLPSELMASPIEFTQSVRESVEAAELRVADVFLQVGLDPADSSTNDPNPAVRARNREVFCRALELCHDLGCGHLTGLPGVHHDDVVKDFDLAAMEAAWRLDRCTDAGVVYAIEPHVGSICADTASVHRLLSGVRGLTVTLDYGHFISLGEENAAVHNLVSHASHLHVRGAAPGHLQSALADNTIDFSGMMSRLSQTQYRGTLALEYVWTEWQGCNRTDNVSETLLLRQRLLDIASKLENEMRCSD
jgi:sugar phosphate isomerase/epimerase